MVHPPLSYGGCRRVAFAEWGATRGPNRPCRATTLDADVVCTDAPVVGNCLTIIRVICEAPLGSTLVVVLRTVNEGIHCDLSIDYASWLPGPATNERSRDHPRRTGSRAVCHGFSRSPSTCPLRSAGYATDPATTRSAVPPRTAMCTGLSPRSKNTHSRIATTRSTNPTGSQPARDPGKLPGGMSAMRECLWRHSHPRPASGEMRTC